MDNNEKFRSFKSQENIHKKEVGPYRGFGYLSLISDPIDLASLSFVNFSVILAFKML